MAAKTRSVPPARPLRIVFISSELAPLAQTGGLGEAVSGLARGLAQRGHTLQCILPAYRSVLTNPALPPLEETGGVEVPHPGGVLRGQWLTGSLGSVGVHLLDVEGLFDRSALYGEDDDGSRFVAFARAAAARTAEIAPDVMVAHDWQSALSICMLRTLHDRGRARGIATVQVVHNNAHQGRFEAGLLEATGLPGDLFAPDGLEFFGELSLLKGGLVWADRIVAVSPSYAKELLTPEFGQGLEGLYNYREHRLVGIANGIDTEVYDPAKDAALPSQFDRKTLRNRLLCREALLDELGLDTPETGMLLGCVGRLAMQKGWDLIAEAGERLVRQGASLVLLGDGDEAIAEKLTLLSRHYPGQVSFRTGWNPELARRIYAGSDSILVPSRFEPCGLVQLIAQRYGALPIAHAVGGLGDTIEDGKTGILFNNMTVEGLTSAVDRGATLRREHGIVLDRTLLREDVSWSKPAGLWEKELRAVTAEARARM